MKAIEVLAPAKVNLFLKILNRRNDGFHDIETVFEKISLFDRIAFREIPRNTIVFKSNLKGLSAKNNSIYRAASLIKRKFRISQGLDIYLDKRIPVAAGLGGGSSDAAYTIQALNGLWKLGLSAKELLNLASAIGSDAALFMLKESFVLGKGRGERVFPIKVKDNFKLWHILIVPKVEVSTPRAYSLFDKYYLEKKVAFQGAILHRKLRLTMPPYSVNIIVRALLSRDVSLLNYYSYNTFESLILRQFPELAGIKRAIEEKTGNFVYLSGSGSALFLTFSNRKGVGGLLGKVRKAAGNCRLFLVHTL